MRKICVLGVMTTLLLGSGCANYSNTSKGAAYGTAGGLADATATSVIFKGSQLGIMFGKAVTEQK